MPLQKEQIIRTAIQILDRDGLEGVTLRRLAKELDVKAASIYWHIPNKEALLDEMANAILTDRFSGYDFSNDQRDWAEWLNTLAHDLRAAMLAHREGARVVAGAHLGIAVMLVKLVDLSIRVLHNGGFKYGKAATIAVTVTDFCFGYVIEEQASPPLGELQDEWELSEEYSAFWEEFPTLVAVMEAWTEEDNDLHFDTAMRIIINGVRAEQ